MRWQTVAWLVGFACCVVAFAPQYSVDAKHTHRVSNNVFDELATAPQTECLVALYVEVNWSAGHAVHHHTFELRNMASSSYDFTLTWSRSAGGSGHFYVFDLRSDASSSGDFASTVSGDDLSVAYTASTWSDGSTSYYEFEAHKSATESGTFTKQTAVNDDVSPAAITNLPEGWYKVRGRRCIDSARTECGAWTSLSGTAVEVSDSPPPPTALATSRSNDNDNLRLTYRQSASADLSRHSYQFELHRSTTSSGTYTRYATRNDIASPLDFIDVPTDHYYKVRGRRCASTGTGCGAWTSWTTALNVPPKSEYTAPTISNLTVSGDADDMTVSFSRSTVASLDSHHYAFELHRADSATGTFSRSKTASATSSPGMFEGIDRSKVYKARGKRCETDKEKLCGPWSALSSVWDGPSPPSALTLSLANENSLSASYTRSTTPTATTHYYQFKLVRSETASGTYADYGDIESTTLAASATASQSFGDVHTGYHYKAVGRRCSTATADCGEWSSVSGATALNVPVTDESAPSIATSKSTEGDDIEVTFPDDSDNGPSGQAVTPGVLPDASYYVVELRRAKTSNGTFEYYDSSTAGSSTSPMDVTFTDVDPGWFYKARARACAGTDRKLCGAWTAQPSPFEVANPTGFPSLTAPTVKPSGNGALTADLTLPSSLYIYVVTLEKSKTGTSYATEETERLESTADSVDFAGLDPTDELWYKVALKACHKGRSSSCGPAVRAPPIRLPVIALTAADLTDVDLGTASSISVSAKYMPTDKDFKFEASTSSAGTKAGVLKFGKCAGLTVSDSNETPIPGNPTSAGPTEFAPIGCAEGTDDLTVALKSGTTSYHSASISVTINDDVPTPNDVIASGMTPTDASSKAWVTIRFTPIVGATSYDVRFAVEESSPSNDTTVSTADSDDFRTVSGSPMADGDLRLESRIPNALYKIQIKADINGVKSGWSDATVAFAAEGQPVKSKEVADVTLLGYLPSRHYEYTICENTFRDNRHSGVNVSNLIIDIERGISKWQKAVNWKVSEGNVELNIIRSTRVTPASGSCVAPSEGDSAPWMGKMEVRWESETNFKVACPNEDGAAACVHLPRSEAPLPGETRAEQNELTHLEGDDAPYMVFDGTRRYTIGRVPPAFSCPDLEKLAAHETGHVFGLAHTNADTSLKSVMEEVVSEIEVCGPSIYDVAAVMSIYQNKTASTPTPAEGESQ